ANATLSNATRFLGEVKDHIQKNEIYRMLYGNMFDKSLRWNDEEIEVLGRSTGIREPTVSGIGVGGNLVSQHYSLIIGDDLVSDVNSATRLQADKVVDWWKKSFSLLDPDGMMFLIGTRWSNYELYSYIMDTPELRDQVDVFVRSSVNPDGSLYFPELFNHDKLVELKKLHGSYIYSCFYLNDPIDEEKAIVKQSQIVYYGDELKNDEEVRAYAQKKGLAIFSVCDPAMSQEATSDYTSLTVVGVDNSNNWYILAIYREKYTVYEIIEKLFEVKKFWNPLTMSIEVIGPQQGLIPVIYQAELEKHVSLSLFPIKVRPQVTKAMRIRSILQPKFEQGKILSRRDMVEFEEEILRFPKAKHDDIIDSITDIELIGYPPGSEQTNEQKEPTTKMERHLKNLLQSGNDDYDPVMGEFY
ncbi:MAG: hypothetical protein NUV65_02995, partial [Candidatus Roizmanbacteria bacterium]|nr:hypothetical protein [Candidatus Roizmanbacteria bacterium]